MNTNEHKNLVGLGMAKFCAMSLVGTTANGQREGIVSEATYASEDCSSSAVLKDIAGNKVLRDRLLRQMAASSSWKVGMERGLIVATRQTLSKNNDEKMAPGTENYGTNVRIFLGGYRVTRDLEQVGLAQAGEMNTRLPIVKNKYLPSPATDSILGIHAGEGENSVAVEISEMSADDQRKMTRDALVAVMSELEAFKKANDEVEKEGFIKGITPAGSVIETDGPGLLKVDDGFQKGIYNISGYINPGEAGYITLEAIHVKTGQPIAHESMAMRTLQYVGWSKDPRKKFHFSSEVTLNEMVPRDGWQRSGRVVSGGVSSGGNAGPAGKITKSIYLGTVIQSHEYCFFLVFTL